MTPPSSTYMSKETKPKEFGVSQAPMITKTSFQHGSALPSSGFGMHPQGVHTHAHTLTPHPPTSQTQSLGY